LPSITSYMEVSSTWNTRSYVFVGSSANAQRRLTVPIENWLEISAHHSVWYRLTNRSYSCWVS
jgi:hypothetical protein